MKARHGLIILGALLIALSVAIYYSSPELGRVIEAKPLPMTTLFLMFVGVASLATGLVSSLVNRL